MFARHCASRFNSCPLEQADKNAWYTHLRNPRQSRWPNALPLPLPLPYTISPPYDTLHHCSHAASTHRHVAGTQNDYRHPFTTSDPLTMPPECLSAYSQHMRIPYQPAVVAPITETQPAVTRVLHHSEYTIWHQILSIANPHALRIIYCIHIPWDTTSKEYILHIYHEYWSSEWKLA
jgi:hypothetical protein